MSFLALASFRGLQPARTVLVSQRAPVAVRLFDRSRNMSFRPGSLSLQALDRVSGENSFVDVVGSLEGAAPGKPLELHLRVKIRPAPISEGIDSSRAAPPPVKTPACETKHVCERACFTAQVPPIWSPDNDAVKLTAAAVDSSKFLGRARQTTTAADRRGRFQFNRWASEGDDKVELLHEIFQDYPIMEKRARYSLDHLDRQEQELIAILHGHYDMDISQIAALLCGWPEDIIRAEWQRQHSEGCAGTLTEVMHRIDAQGINAVMTDLHELFVQEYTDWACDVLADEDPLHKILRQRYSGPAGSPWSFRDAVKLYILRKHEGITPAKISSDFFQGTKSPEDCERHFQMLSGPPSSDYKVAVRRAAEDEFNALEEEVDELHEDCGGF